MNITRLYESPIQSTSILPTTSITSTITQLPGLISSLKPIKRISLQLKEESSLLSRFTYKNKNQFKSCKWWKKIIEINKVMERLEGELIGFLQEFGIKNGIDEAGRLGSDELLTGLLRIPRSMLIVEKSISVLLSSASIVEQLIHSKAFMPFAVVLISLTARLYTLSVVLLQELNRTTKILISLMELNPLLPIYTEKIKNLPKSLRHYLTSNSTTINPITTPFPSLPPSRSYTSSPVPTTFTSKGKEVDNGEIGARINRDSFVKMEISTIVTDDLPIRKEDILVEKVEDVIMKEEKVAVVVKQEQVLIKKKKKIKLDDDLSLEEREELLKQERKRKKKKVKTEQKGDMDEIDDIFN